MDFELYQRLLQAEGGNVAGANTNSTVVAINETFTDSPFYQQGTLNGSSIDWIFNGETNTKNLFQEKEFLFRPNQIFERGDSIISSSDTWIIVDKNYSNPIFPKASVSLCNDNLKWKDSSGNIHSYPCATIPYRAIRNIQSDSYTLNMPEGHMFVLVQMNADTSTIVLKQRFILGSQVYEIDGIDDLNYSYQGKGLIYFTAGVTTKNVSTDDFVNRIADNSFIYEAQSPAPSSVVTTGNSTTTPPTAGGGKLWR